MVCGMRQAAVGRPRSEQARVAVLRAVDDLLVEQGYSAMTMKGIAERAGVGRQTVYRWWATKAEILIEASVADARDELIAPVRAGVEAELITFLEALARFLTVSPAGLAYRALLGEAQHDPDVARLVAQNDLIADSVMIIFDRVRERLPAMPADDLATAQLVGPVVYAVLARPDSYPGSMITPHVRSLLPAWSDESPELGGL
jgi:AcrR family transcriptional regulator